MPVVQATVAGACLSYSQESPQPGEDAAEVVADRGEDKMRLQGSEASNPKTLQSRMRPAAEKRILINGLAVVHGRLFKFMVAGTQTTAVRFPGIAIEPSTANVSV
jgi:hypothetical protein